MELIKTYKEFNNLETYPVKARKAIRNAAIRLLSLRGAIDATTNWIRMPYYHHVFDDEKRDFERQLRYLKNFGEFISIDDVVRLVQAKEPIDGRYFCVSFDDGYRCCYSNMMDVTASLDIPVIIYLPTDYIGLSESNEDDLPMIKDNLPGNPKLLSFLNWDHCREMLQHKISFGSHTKTHANLKALTASEIKAELSASKNVIEQELSTPCLHFACPWGLPKLNFDPAVTTPIAQELGFHTFATTLRGKTENQDDLFLLKRDHLLAGWGNYQLNYFFKQ